MSETNGFVFTSDSYHLKIWKFISILNREVILYSELSTVEVWRSRRAGTRLHFTKSTAVEMCSKVRHRSSQLRGNWINLRFWSSCLLASFVKHRICLTGVISVVSEKPTGGLPRCERMMRNMINKQLMQWRLEQQSTGQPYIVYLLRAARMASVVVR